MRTTQSKIDKRSDTNEHEGERKYGDVEFADTTNNKYPIDTPEHIRAAWSYINHNDNAAKYAADDVETIKSRIKRAAKRQGVEISTD
jgi:flagellar biosynthesis protein FlhB